MGNARVLGILAAAALAAGCADTGEVGGTVRHRGRPLPGGTVQVRGADGVVRAGPIGPDGTYRVAGVPAGRAAVGVSYREPADAPRSLTAGSRGAGPSRVNRPKGAADVSVIPEASADPDTSGLGTVVRRGTTTYDIDLDQ